MAERDTLIQLFGTAEPPPTAHRLVAGKLSLEIADGVVRNLCWNGCEVLRAVDYPIRNADWGTFPAVTKTEEIAETSAGFDYIRHFTVGGSCFSGKFTCSGTAAGAVTATMRLHVHRETQVNRAGFVILHPAAGFAGTPLQVTHSDGTIDLREFPDAISPSQPVLDIAGLRQKANGVVAGIVFRGESFEMEDQRNWSDASFKTYCRPLALPYPYRLAASEDVVQSITIDLSGGGSSAATPSGNTVLVGEGTGRKLPELALALEPGWEPATAFWSPIIADATLLRVDLTAPHWPASLKSLVPAVVGALDLEVIGSDTINELEAEMKALAATGIAPRSLLTLPKDWLKSYQPDGIWPRGVSPEQAADLARKHFPRAKIGGGVLTNFTELNRHRSAARAGDFVTHGTTAIVHAADDISVLQTLEALPQIFASAEALAQDKPYRLGLVSIGMRSNPYGSDVAANPDGVRVAMALKDPRQDGLFAAAWVVGAMAATLASRVERIALAAPAGPFGLMQGTRARPIFHVHQAFVRMQTAQRLSVSPPPGIAAVAVAGATVIANLGKDPQRVNLPESGRVIVLDRLQPSPGWLHTAPRGRATAIDLPAFSVAFVETGSGDLFGSKA